MRFDLILPWWILLPLGSAVLVLFVRQIIIKKEMRTVWLTRAAMVALLLCMTLRPYMQSGSAQSGVTSLDVFLAIDVTGSMSAEDYNGTKPRLDGVRSDVKALVSQLAGARFSIILFDNKNATLSLPLTTDGSAVLSGVDAADTEITYYSNGSSIDKPVDALKTVLSNAKKADPGRARVLFFMSDGEQTDGTKPKSFADLKPYLYGGFVLGYGTTNGGRMLENSGYSEAEKQYIKDYSAGGSPVPDARSKIDEGNLRTAAQQMGIQYVHRTKPTDGKELSKEIHSENISTFKENVTARRQFYWLFAVLMVGVLMYEITLMFDELAVFRSLRSRKAGYGKK